MPSNGPAADTTSTTAFDKGGAVMRTNRAPAPFPPLVPPPPLTPKSGKGLRPLCGTTHDARIWLTLDCCGLTTASITWAIVVFSEIVVTKALLKRKPFGFAAQAAVFNLVSVLALVSHGRAMLSDPGAVPKGAEPLRRDGERAKAAAAAKAGFRARAKGWCHRCGSYKPPRAHHDSVTGRCVVKLDHYCPWTNNAIGVRNHKFFLLFILYVFFMCFYTLTFFFFLLVESASDYRTPGETVRDQNKKMRRRNRGEAQEDLPDVNAANCAVAFFALLFGLFTACMLCDQWSVLTTNVAKIDRLKGDADDLCVVSGVNEVFGGRPHASFRVEWLLPTLPRFPNSVHDDIMGYQTSVSILADLESQPVDDDERSDERLRLLQKAAGDSNGDPLAALREAPVVSSFSSSSDPELASSSGAAEDASLLEHVVVAGGDSVPQRGGEGKDLENNPKVTSASTSIPLLGRLGGVFSDKDTRHTV